MRYVGATKLGIGGLEPFPATFVDQQEIWRLPEIAQRLYVRCLRAVHIPSNYAVINAETNKGLTG